MEEAATHRPLAHLMVLLPLEVRLSEGAHPSEADILLPAHLTAHLHSAALGLAHHTVLPRSDLPFLHLQAHTAPHPAHHLRTEFPIKREDKPQLDGH